MTRLPAFCGERPQQCPPDKKAQQAVCKEKAGAKYEECLNTRVAQKDCAISKACAGEYCRKDCQSMGGGFWRCHFGCGFRLRGTKQAPGARRAEQEEA